MKTVFKITTVLCVAAFFQTNETFSQELGARFGDALGNKSSVAVDAIFSTGKFNRIHADVSFGNGVGVEALWDFIYRPISNSPLNYYIGVGPSLYLGDPFLLGAAGELGVEFRFKDAPLALGLDWRPTFVIIENTDFTSGFGFNVRYVFGGK
jgi:hypothetical protein